MNWLSNSEIAQEEQKKLDFDAVEVHGAHGYLIGAFASPFPREVMNTEERSVRARFAMEIIENSYKEKCSIIQFYTECQRLNMSQVD